MDTIFMNGALGKSVKVSGDIVIAGYVCPFSIISLKKIVTGSFLPSSKISENDRC